jgi:hypothetical protein
MQADTYHAKTKKPDTTKKASDGRPHRGLSAGVNEFLGAARTERCRKLVSDDVHDFNGRLTIQSLYRCCIGLTLSYFPDYVLRTDNHEEAKLHMTVSIEGSICFRYAATATTRRFSPGTSSQRLPAVLKMPRKSALCAHSSTFDQGSFSNQHQPIARFVGGDVEIRTYHISAMYLLQKLLF